MPSWLKQSTSVDVGIGPFLDETDGKTAETGLTITQPDIRLKKNGGAWAQKNAAQTLSHEEAGWYELTLDATDTNTLGLLIVAIHESGALPVWKEYMVVPAMIYDSIVAGSDRLDTNVTHVGDTAQTAGDIIGDTNDIQTRLPAALVSGRIDASVGAMAANVLTATAINADAITAAKVAADVSAEIADAVWDEDATGHQTGGTFGQAIGDPGADTNTIFKAVVTDATGATVGVDVAAVLADTGTDGVVVASIAANAVSASALATDAVNEIVDQVWREAIADHSGTAGSTAEQLAAAGAAGDPWATAVPGAYGAGTAGKILGDNLNATVSSRASQTSLDTVDDFLDTEVAAIKAKTDSLTFTVAGQVDANIQSVNDVTVTGTGAAGDEWGP